MARVHQNFAMQGMVGLLGNQIVFKRDKAGRTIVSAKPTFAENRVFSAAQQAQHQAFREATAYAIGQKDNPIYIEKAEGTTMNAYNLAVADWFNEPEILGIDLSGWDGSAGGTVRVQARDDVQVKHVIVRFSDTNGDTLEEGSAVDVGALWWEYTAQGNRTGTVTVTATAIDLPGNMTELSREKTIS